MNSRTAQLVAATLAFLLIVLVGVTIFVLLSRPPAPRPSPSPSPLPSASASPAVSGSLSPTPTLLPSLIPTPTLVPSALPTETASPEPSATATASPSPSPTPTPSISPTSPQRELTLFAIGLDRRSDPTGVQRSVSFTVDGPSLLTAQLSDVSAGSVRMCLSRQAADPERACRTMRNGVLRRAVFDAGQTTWNVSLIGTSDLASPFVTLTLGFNSLSPTVHLDSFRFNGTTDPHYNGFVVGLTAAADGNLRVQASFDDGQGNPYQYHLVITRTGNSEVLADQAGGPQGSLDVSLGLLGGEAYRVELGEPEVQAGGGLFAVFVDATLTWP